MFFADSVFVGIGAASSQESFTYAALDKNLNLIALANGAMGEVTAFLAGQESTIVAVCSPSSLSRGLAQKKSEMFKTPKKQTSEYRFAESTLRAKGISISGTPSTLAACAAWIKAGFSLYRKLEKIGFKKYPSESAPYQMLETQTHACFCALTGGIPLPRTSLEGKLQRQLILYEAGLRIKDPMEFFEEITRHKMIRGVWPVELLYSPDQLDALMAAYAAWVSIHKPSEVTLIGDEKEGRILIPVRELKEKYSS